MCKYKYNKKAFIKKIYSKIQTSNTVLLDAFFFLSTLETKIKFKIAKDIPIAPSTSIALPIEKFILNSYRKAIVALSDFPHFLFMQNVQHLCLPSAILLWYPWHIAVVNTQGSQ